MWYKPWESDVVVLATQAPAAAKLTAQILKSVGADGDGGDGYGIASKISRWRVLRIESEGTIAGH